MQSFPDVVTRCGLSRVIEFLNAGADIHETNTKGRTALHCAARLGKHEIIQLLVHRKVEIDATDANGETSLQLASRKGHLQCAELLINSGAGVNHLPSLEKTEFSETALCSAIRKGHSEIAQLLLANGADCNLVSEAKRYPLIFAVHSGNISLAESLLRAKAAPNVLDHSGSSPLHISVNVGSLELCELLLHHGADVNARDSIGETALHLAARRDTPLIAESLIRSGAEIEIHGHAFKMTPLQLCCSFDCPEVRRVLLENGARPWNPEDLRIAPPTISVEVTLEDLTDSDDELALEDEQSDEVILGESFENDTIFVDVPSSAKKMAAAICTELKAEPREYLAEYWTCSRRHINALTKLDVPLSLERIAYFARGFLNGHESDGPKVIGETYRDFVERLLAEQAIRRLPDEETAGIVVSATDLKRKAEVLGLNKSGTKQMLLNAIVSSCGISALRELVGDNFLYLRTDAGSRIVESYEPNLAKLKAEWMKHSFEKLRSNDVKAAARLVWKFESLANVYASLATFEHTRLPQAIAVLNSKNKKLLDHDHRLAQTMAHLWRRDSSQ